MTVSTSLDEGTPQSSRFTALSSLVQTLLVNGHRTIYSLCVLAILVLSCWVRLSSIGHLLPHYPETDRHYMVQARAMREGNERPTGVYTAYSAYPHLLSRILSWVPLHDDPPEAGEECDVDELLRLASIETRNARILIAILGSISVFLFWLLARVFFPQWWTLVATLFYSSSLLHVAFSSVARPHVGSASLALAAVLACLLLARRGDSRSYALAGVAVALAIASLQIAAFVVLSLLVAHWYVVRGGAGGGHRRLLLPGVLLIAALLLFYPYLYLHQDVGKGGSIDHYGRLIGLSNFNGRGFAYMLREALAHDPVLTYLSALGVVLGAARLLRSRGFESHDLRRDVLIFAASAVPYALAISIYDHLWQRFLIPLIPAAALLSTLALRETAVFLGRWGQSTRTVGVLLSLVALAMPITLTAKFVWLRGQKDSMQQCVEWITENLDRTEDRVATSPWVTLPLLQQVPRGRGLLEREHSAPIWQWYRYQLRLPEELVRDMTWNVVALASGGIIPLEKEGYYQASRRARKFLFQLRPDHVVIREEHGVSGRMDKAVREWGELVRSFGPFTLDPTRFHIQSWFYQNDLAPYRLGKTGLARDPLWRQIWRADCLGPHIELYRKREKPPSR